MKYFLQTLLRVFLWTISIIMVFLVVSGLFQRFFNKNGYTGMFGIGYAVVVSGSMEPVFMVDDMIIYQKHGIDDYHVGDIVVYVRDRGTDKEMLITHRIVDMNMETLTTKGDANNRADEPIYYHQLVGKVVWNIGKVGKAVTFLRSGKGILTLIAVLLVIIAADIYFSVFRKRKQKVLTIQGEEYLRY